MTSSSDVGRQWCGGIFFRQHTPALPPSDFKSLCQICRCFLRAGLKTLRPTDSLPPPSYSKFLASKLLSDGHLETPMPELCFKGCLEPKAGTLQKLSQYLKYPPLSLLGHLYSAINTNFKATGLLGVLDEDMGASCLSLPFKNEVAYLGFEKIQYKTLRK